MGMATGYAPIRLAVCVGRGLAVCVGRGLACAWGAGWDRGYARNSEDGTHGLLRGALPGGEVIGGATPVQDVRREA